MKRIFLTSSADQVAARIAEKIDGKGMKLAFIKTASEVEDGDLWWLKNDRNALVKVGFEVSDYTITGKTKEQIEKDLDNKDVIFFSGGNTLYLLQQIQKSDCAMVIRDYINNGKIYIGSSAGSIVASEDIYSLRLLEAAEKAPELIDYKGLGLVDFIVAPHWSSDAFRNLYINERINNLYESKDKIILLNDNQYVEVKDDWCRIVGV